MLLETKTNQELEQMLLNEFIYYDENLNELAHIIRTELPKQYVYRILSKLYRLRND